MATRKNNIAEKTMAADKILRKAVLLLLIILGGYLSGCATGSAGSSYDDWKSVETITGEIISTSFPEKDFSILDFGALPGSGEPVTDALNKAIGECSASGGGRVVIPPGTYITGAIRLLSNVNLHIQEGAVLRFSNDPEAYLPLVLTRWEGVDCYNYSPLIHAAEAENIAVTGKGILDGQASDTSWWWWKGRTEYGWKAGMPSQSDEQGRPRLMKYLEDEVPVEERLMGKDGYLRPPFIQFLQCKAVLVEGITIKNSPFWLIHPLLSESVTVRGVRADSHGPNNDGCDPESCKNVLIEGCYFDTGDDCIAIKSGRNGDGRRWSVPSENIIVRNCEMRNGHGGVVIGSEISGGCRNVFVEDCLMNSPQLERAIRIKTNSLRGGIVENIFVRNLTIGEVDEAVLKINCIYELKDGQGGEHLPLVRNIRIDNVRSEKSKYGIYLQGLEESAVIHDIHITNCHFNGVEKGNYLQYADEPRYEKVYINNELIH